MAEESKISSFILRMLEQFGSDFLAAAVVHRGYTSGDRAGKDGKSLSAKGVRDNAVYRNLLAKTNKKFQARLQVKIGKFIKFLWSKMDTATQRKLVEKSEQGIGLGAGHVATFNAESEARQLLAIPLVVTFAEMAELDEEKAMFALKDFCEQTMDEMLADYEVFVAQPEAVHDKFIRWIFGSQSFSSWLKNRDQQAKRNVARAKAPGGIIFKIKHQSGGLK